MQAISLQRTAKWVASVALDVTSDVAGRIAIGIAMVAVVYREHDSFLSDEYETVAD